MDMMLLTSASLVRSISYSSMGDFLREVAIDLDPLQVWTVGLALRILSQCLALFWKQVNSSVFFMLINYTSAGRRCSTLRFINNYLRMDNYISCPMILSQLEYERLISRFLAFTIHKQETRLLLVSLFEPILHPDDPLKPPFNIRDKLTHKFETPIVKISYPRYSCLAFGTASLSSVEFPFKSSLTMVDNSFDKIISTSRIFENMRESQKITLEMETFTWGNLFQFEFYHCEESADDVLLIMKDLNSNLNIFQTNKPKQLQGPKEIEDKVRLSFSTIFETILSDKREHGNKDLWEGPKFDRKFSLFRTILAQISSSPEVFLSYCDESHVNTWLLNHMSIIHFVLKSSIHQK